jgi:hypothetical protein
MTRRWLTLWLMLVLALALAGCSGVRKPEESKVDPNLFPADYKQKITRYLQLNLQDPFGIRDAAIAPPTLRQLDTEPRYVVCVRYNPRLDGKYLGIDEKAFVFFGGEFNQVITATPQHCGGAAYQPFPELQALKPLK